MNINPTDHFSTKSKEYSFSRPVYPESLYDYLYTITSNKGLVWDCATGNGQAAIGLCKYFRNVIASDISPSQIENRFTRDNITYEVFSAENPALSSNTIDLITVAQALHWFDFERFYKEVRRVGRSPAGIIAVWSYGMHKINPEIDKISDRLTVGGDILGDYWPNQTEYVKQDYRTIPFPFEEIAAPKFEMKVDWSLNDLVNYMHTWSSVKKFQLEKKYDPLSTIKEELENLWGIENHKKSVIWNINIRIGKINS